jgi:hypothetical protein
MASIGQFMHLPTYNTYSTGSINRSVTFPSTFVGGSIACPNIDPNYTADTSNPGSNRLMIDHSFRANESLFDSYFFSTVPSIINSNPASSVYPTPYNNFKAESIENSKPLPNNRMKYYRKEGKSPDIDDLRDVNKVAANLILDGAFNVNSTSVNAWISLLSSLSGNSLAIYNSFTRQITSLDPDTLKNPIPRFLNASASGNVNQAWDGTRALTDEEVKKLAQKIVEQVKLRGPFLSMGDFFNRRLGSSASPYTLNGALQAAIDQTNINASIENMGSDISFPSDIEDNPKLDINRFPPRTSKTTAGIPGYLMQQDLVQSFSPVMTVRSDTFIVRAYGEATNLSSTDKAWLEAVVQRTPEYIDSAIDKFPELKPAPNSINGVFGRRYKIVSFRWLNENEL